MPCDDGPDASDRSSVIEEDDEAAAMVRSARLEDLGLPWSA